jgi:hypothetical protein
MFGQQDDQYQHSQDADTPQHADDVTADGTLSAPAATNDMHDEGMPDYEPTAAPNGTTDHRQNANTPEELISIKQEALQSLKPLVSHLQLSAKDKFRTTMMMIQASDDQSLIPEAYESAKAIEDEKERAQALLDVVNEINYFTAQNAQQ